MVDAVWEDAITEAVTPPNPAGAGRGGHRPDPDPTLLTIDLTRREIAMNTEASLRALAAIERFYDERFRQVERQMAHAEDLRKEQKADSNARVDAALEAQKDATAKMERSIEKAIEGLASTFSTEVRGLRETGESREKRLTIVEAHKAGQSEQRAESRQIAAGWYALIGAVGGVILVLLALYPFLRTATP